MGRSMTSEAGRLAFHDADSGELAGSEQHKLDRLLELRAVIVSLRAERVTAPSNELRAGQNRFLAV